MALKEFLQHSKESSRVLGQASKQAGREGVKEASKKRKEGSFQGKGERKLYREERKEVSNEWKEGSFQGKGGRKSPR